MEKSLDGALGVNLFDDEDDLDEVDGEEEAVVEEVNSFLSSSISFPLRLLRSSAKRAPPFLSLLSEGLTW